MLIAREKRKTNIAEYILYMWQIEDLLRACSFDREKINQQLAGRFDVDDDLRIEISNWYINLAVMMEKEHVQERGHLQVLINLVNDLNEFHLKMLEVKNDQEYIQLYRQNRNAIAEINQLSGPINENEIEACLNALYGFLMLRLKNAEVTDTTKQTIAGFSQMLGHLSARYIQFENDDFEF
jgi:hypothetical protein